MSTQRPTSKAPLTLQEVSERLGVHYMTAYRYVRTGRLPAFKRDGAWVVERRDVDRLRTRDVRAPAGRGRAAYPRRVPELAGRLVAGDEQGAWAVAQSALAGGASPVDLYMEIFVPALRLIGELWERDDIGIADEHCATVIVQRLIGRAGPLFHRRGRTRGALVLGAPAGELHAIPTALAADLLRGHGFAVLDLGANVPAPSFVDNVLALPRVVAVGIAVTTPQRQAAAGRLVAAMRRAGVSVPIILGGSGLDEADARRLGADAWARTAAELADLVNELP